MGTRALVHVKEDGKTLVTIYRQFDGYPDGLGMDIKKAIGNLKLVNGFGDPEGVANGMGCLAATLIKNLKGRCGNVYIYPPDSSDVGEEYVYEVYEVDGEIHISCADDTGKPLYSGQINKVTYK